MFTLNKEKIKLFYLTLSCIKMLIKGYILPKGSSFADLDDDKINLMEDHINNEKRDSLNGHSPYELSLLLLDNKLHRSLGLKAIAPDDVMLSPKLIK